MRIGASLAEMESPSILGKDVNAPEESDAKLSDSTSTPAAEGKNITTLPNLKHESDSKENTAENANDSAASPARHHYARQTVMMVSNAVGERATNIIDRTKSSSSVMKFGIETVAALSTPAISYTVQQV